MHFGAGLVSGWFRRVPLVVDGKPMPVCVSVTIRIAILKPAFSSIAIVGRLEFDYMLFGGKVSQVRQGGMRGEMAETR